MPACRPVRVGISWQGQVRREDQAVARRDFHGVHARQRRAVEIRARREHLREGLRAAIVDPECHGLDQAVDERNPQLVVVRSARDLPIAFRLAIEEVQVRLDGLVDDEPVVAQILGRDGLDLAGERVHEQPLDIGLGRLDEDRRLSRGEIERGQGRLVAGTAVQQVEGCPGRVEAERLRRQRVFGPDLQQRLGIDCAARRLS